jgi:hypothetical protein
MSLKITVVIHSAGTATVESDIAVRVFFFAQPCGRSLNNFIRLGLGAVLRDSVRENE